jgi:hypothetical protein
MLPTVEWTKTSSTLATSGDPATSMSTDTLDDSMTLPA